MRAAASLLSSCFPRSFLSARSRLPGRRGRAAAGGGAEGGGGGEEESEKQTNQPNNFARRGGRAPNFPAAGERDRALALLRGGATRAATARARRRRCCPAPASFAPRPPQPGSPAPVRAEPAVISRTRPWAELAGEAASTPPPLASTHAPSPPSTAAGCSPRLRRHPAPSCSAGGRHECLRPPQPRHQSPAAGGRSAAQLRASGVEGRKAGRGAGRGRRPKGREERPLLAALDD